ncbi:MAG: hypothetical protein DRJ05_05510 [Bacteroidetes bacterium]|nr:MAG: hypothetical protein DRJ05_05510 [Bacteroidota bacterium]
MRYFSILLLLVSTKSVTTFFARNEGEIVGSVIGTFGAAIVAILTIFLTTKMSAKRQRAKDKTRYEGQLTFVLWGITDIEHKLHLLERELESLEESSLREHRIIISEAPSKINYSVIEKNIQLLIEYDNFNNNLNGLLLAFISSLRNLNINLNFNAPNEIIQNISSGAERDPSIENYFSSISEYIKRAIDAIPTILQMIEKELKDYTKKNKKIREKGKKNEIG